ncbi:L-lactate dehydrogenase complex protein LldF [Oryzomicrobium terrae]|uniref:L-lactate dehydrogenase complex protein LldF n=1 Tax=Oryzomicrobium terrae TaxID=1735038 RepID=A0A5C1EA79_9RHOO|nr:LutB/LldF family L-lactate oxidation iron-sulfur protein [Oryzomicrobium terrae]QEL65793.1 L-lactate dehydrogenase complex protein LldF [Oryzomicrobium terrae]
MEVRSIEFKQRASERAIDGSLQGKLKTAKGLFVGGRARAVARFDAEGGDFEALRDIGRGIRDEVLDNLDVWLETFEQNATARGATVLWARDGAEISRLVVEIAQRHGVKKAIKSKSMLSEEAGLNEALEAVGVASIETDLGEYIIQLAKEPPSHIIAPAIHKNKEEVADLFEQHHHKPRKTEIAEMTREAREVLRSHFVSADMGITGGNFLVAETGSVALVTNEGNGRMVTTLPKVHVAVVGVEKVIPSLNDLAALMRLLPRSATGQTISNYVSLLTGVKAEADRDGPEHLYFILVDNGRVGLVGSEFQEMLRCIRCGACMNHCPVYQTIGGHAYGWVYPGPMGSVLTPLYTGLDKAPDLPHAATLCNQCGVVCPVKIPLPELLRKLREKQVQTGVGTATAKAERRALKLWGFAARHPRLYAFGTRIATRYLKWLAGGKDRIQTLSMVPEWTKGRDFPAPEGKTFRELYAQRAARRG